MQQTTTILKTRKKGRCKEPQLAGSRNPKVETPISNTGRDIYIAIDKLLDAQSELVSTLNTLVVGVQS